jgi:ankyrin repeat protein
MFIITKFDVQLNCPFSTPIPEEIQITESKNWNSTPIHKAIYANSSVDVADLLRVSSHSHHHRNQMGWTLLHFAVFLKRIECIQVLLTNGADIFAPTTQFGYTSLHFACFRGDISIIDLLLSSLHHKESNVRFSKKKRRNLDE